MRYYEGKEGKFKLKYEVVCTIIDPRIIHVSCRHPGSTADITIARLGLIKKMRHNEECLADLGCRGPEPQLVDLEPHEIDFNSKLNATSSKKEQVNKRIKDFQIAAGVWRHDYEFNEVCFHAVCKIINQTLVYQPISR
jgi:hypothetical protein